MNQDLLEEQHLYGYDLPAGGGGGGCDCANTQAKPTSITLPSGKKTVLQYDAEWQLILQITAHGTADAATTSFTYDAAGNLLTQTDPRGKVWTFAYDTLNRRVKSTDPLSNETRFGFDAAGNNTSLTRPDAGIVTNVFNSMNQVIQTTDPKNQVTQMTYDLAGNLTTLTDARANAYAFTYDLLNRKLTTTHPDNTQEAMAYDSVGNLASMTTRAGKIRTYQYDTRNRETHSEWNDGVTPAITRVYDSANRLTSLTNNVSVLTYAYDDAGQLLSEQQDLTAAGGQSKTISHTWDADGNLASLTYPDATVLNYAYTGRNQLLSITSGGTLAAYTYDANGNRLSKALENGTSVNYSHDDANRVTLVDHKKAATAFASFSYGFDNVNRRTDVTREDGKSDRYAYDSVDQVTGVNYNTVNGNNPDRTVDYALDAVGNRTSVTNSLQTIDYVANSLNQYTQVGAAAPTYGLNGNLLTHVGWTYTYDAQNRLTQASNGATTVAFSYDPRNRCVKRTLNGTATYFYFDSWSLLEERDAAGAVLAKYINGSNVDEILKKTSGSVSVYYHHDSLGNVTHLTDSTGDLVEKYKYDIFGAPTFFNGSGTPISASAFGNRFLFTGREFIAEISLYDYRNRFYDAALGRFLQPDPIGFDGGDINIYRYVANDPINKIDPFGLDYAVEISANCAEFHHEFTQTSYSYQRTETGWVYSGEGSGAGTRHYHIFTDIVTRSLISRTTGYEIIVTICTDCDGTVRKSIRRATVNRIGRTTLFSYTLYRYQNYYHDPDFFLNGVNTYGFGF